ncbi:MAG: putative F420-dependent oxidoreductase [Glaciecola sp.]|jgi:probable F420-dependent oxidoreductase
MSGRLRVGATSMLTDQGIDVVDLARELESRGFDALHLPEHTHMPVVREIEHPLMDSLPEEYRRTLDPFVALSMAAAVTTRLRLGTGILLLGQRDPIVTAKAIATLDHLSDGRFVLGLGYGWNREELADHGVAWGDRRAVIHERLSLMQALWSQEVASFDGQTHHLPASAAWPKPKAGGVPVWLGVSPGPNNFAAVAQIADAWIPHGSSGLETSMAQLHATCESGGRDPATVATIPFGVLPTPGKIQRLLDLGIREIVTLVDGSSRDVAMRTLDEQSATLDTVLGSSGWQRS